MLLKELEFFHSTLQVEISFIDFAHVRSLFLRHNGKVLKQKSTIQQKKFNHLPKDKKPQHDPGKGILIILSMFYQKRKSLFFRRVSTLAFRLIKLVILITLSTLNYFIQIELRYS